MFIYRCGLAAWDVNKHKAIFSHTWRSDDPETANTPYELAALAGQLIYIFNTYEADLTYGNWRAFGERIYPRRKILWTVLTSPTAFAELNPNAPEAAFRLQRVGAAGSVGHIFAPIRSDRYYLDLPHRRKVNVELLAPLLAEGIDRAPKTFSGYLRTYTNVLVHRHDMTTELVVAHRLLPNPCRVWKRWRELPRPPTPHFIPGAVPPEVTDAQNGL